MANKWCPNLRYLRPNLAHFTVLQQSGRGTDEQSEKALLIMVRPNL